MTHHLTVKPRGPFHWDGHASQQETAMQAIVVKFLGPTNTKPSRWSVSCVAKRIIVSKGAFSETNDSQDARLAAEHLCELLGWERHGRALIEGGLPNGDRVFVFPEL